MTINEHAAVVKTASVEIKMITVNNRKMPLNVFRQLISEPVICSKTGTLNGAPWGFINYFWKNCGGPESEHLHVVWQKDGALRRDCLMDYDPCGPHVPDTMFHDLIRGCEEMMILHIISDKPTEAWPPLEHDCFVFSNGVDGSPVFDWGWGRLLSPPSYRPMRELIGTPDGVAEIRAEARKRLRRGLPDLNKQLARVKHEQFSEVPTYERLQAIIARSVEVAAARKAHCREIAAQWEESYLHIKNLGQLFITV